MHDCAYFLYTFSMFDPDNVLWHCMHANQVLSSYQMVMDYHCVIKGINTWYIFA